MLSTAFAISQLDDTSIANTAERARQLLFCCRDIPFQQHNARRLAAAQYSRFNLWASNIGVFSSKQSSLDYRLRTAPTAKAAIDGNIEILCRQLLCVLAGCDDVPDDQLDAFAETALEKSTDPADLRTTAAGFGLMLLDSSSSTEATRLSLLHLVETTIDTLHRLSLAIRKASNRNALARIPKLVGIDKGYNVERTPQNRLCNSGDPVEQAIFDATPGFEDFLRRTLKSRWLRAELEPAIDSPQQHYRDTMLQRCIASISMRRRQLAYFQNHQAKLAMPEYRDNRQLSAKAKVPPFQRTGSLEVRDSSTLSENPEGSAAIKIPLSETVPSEFNIASFRPPPSTAAPSSAGSGSDAGGLGNTSVFEVPPAPELERDEKEKMCPYCCLVFPAKTFATHKRSRRWRKHLIEDLQPYICLFQNCSQAGKTYQTFREWQNHLSQPHVQDWWCPLAHPEALASEAFVYSSAEEFQEHMGLFHSDMETSRQHSVLRAAGRRAESPQWCFVCLAEQTSDVTLQQHLGRHLESAFLLALPGRDDIKDSNEAPSGRASHESARSAITPLYEADNSDIRELYNDDSDRLHNTEARGLAPGELMTRLAEIGAKGPSMQEQGDILSAWVDEVAADTEDSNEEPALRKCLHCGEIWRPEAPAISPVPEGPPRSQQGYDERFEELRRHTEECPKNRMVDYFHWAHLHQVVPGKPPACGIMTTHVSLNTDGSLRRRSRLQQEARPGKDKRPKELRDVEHDVRPTKAHIRSRGGRPPVSWRALLISAVFLATMNKSLYHLPYSFPVRLGGTLALSESTPIALLDLDLLIRESNGAFKYVASFQGDILGKTFWEPLGCLRPKALRELRDQIRDERDTIKRTFKDPIFPIEQVSRARLLSPIDIDYVSRGFAKRTIVLYSPLSNGRYRSHQCEVRLAHAEATYFVILIVHPRETPGSKETSIQPTGSLAQRDKTLRRWKKAYIVVLAITVWRLRVRIAKERIARSQVSSDDTNSSQRVVTSPVTESDNKEEQVGVNPGMERDSPTLVSESGQLQEVPDILLLLSKATAPEKSSYASSNRKLERTPAMSHWTLALNMVRSSIRFRSVIPTKIIFEYDEDESIKLLMASAYNHYLSRNWKTAESLERGIFARNRQLRGDGHPAVLTNMANVATLLAHQGRWEEAEDMEREVLQKRLDTLGSEHPDTLISLANLAATCANRDQIEEARTLLGEVVEVGKRMLGEKDKNVLMWTDWHRSL